MKFEIFQSEKDGKYYWRLKAANGQVILTSQGYASKASAKNGIESVKKNCADDANFLRKESSNGKHFFSLIAANKQVIGQSQMYADKGGMENGIDSVKRTAPQAEVVDLTAAD